MEVDASGGHPSIRFVTRTNTTVRLELFEEKHLVGTITMPSERFGNDRAMTLEKKE
jgi:hypothetical protein